MNATEKSFSKKFLKINFILIFLFALVFNSLNTNAQNKVRLEKLWATDSVFQTPEGIVIDYENEVLFVSNVNNDPWVKDDNGFISKVSFEGEVLELKWAEEMSGPKGMGIFNNILYAADIDAVVKINLKNGKVIERISVDPENSLNDISVSKNGDVYVSASGRNKIFKLEGNKLVVAKEDDYNRPNGLLAEKDRLLVLTSGSSSLFELDYNDFNKTKLAENLGHGDGIAYAGDNSYILSDWQGQLFFMDESNNVTTLIDTRDKKINTADIAYHIQKNILFVPTFFDNRIIAFKLEK